MKSAAGLLFWVINSVVEFLLYTEAVGGSNPSSPIPNIAELGCIDRCMYSHMKSAAGLLFCPISPTAETGDLKSLQYQFESDIGYYIKIKYETH